MACANTFLRVKCYSLVCVLFLLCPSYVLCHSGDLSVAEHKHVHCSHEHPKADDVVTGVHLGPAHVVRKRSIDQPLRISIFYDHSVYRLEPTKFDLINNTILPEAVKFWEQALMVRKTSGPIRLNRKCPTRQVFIRGGVSHCIDSCRSETLCGEVRVPEHHLNITPDPFTRLPIKKYQYDPPEKSSTEKEKINLRNREKKPRSKQLSAANHMNEIRDSNKPKLPRDHEDDVPVKEADEDYVEKQVKKQDSGKKKENTRQQLDKLVKKGDSDTFDRFVEEKDENDEMEEKEFNRFEVKKKAKPRESQKFDDEGQDNEKEEFNQFEVKKDVKQDTQKKDETTEDSGYETQKFRRFSTIKRPAYHRDFRNPKEESRDVTEPQVTSNTEEPDQRIKNLRELLYVRAKESEETKPSTLTTTTLRNEFDQYDDIEVKPATNFYLTARQANTAPENTISTLVETKNTPFEKNDNEKLKVLEEYTEPPVVNLSAENVNFRQQTSIESDTNYDAFNEAKQDLGETRPILESVLSQKLHAKAIATSGALLLPCFVCNSTGHNCRALRREELPPIDEEEQLTPWQDQGNSLTDTPELSDVPDETEEPAGVEDSDFVLYVSAVETERCRRGLTVAYASHCQQESALDRPVAGHANFCPGELSTKYRDLPSVMSTVKHEMLHALGFSVSLFAFYRDDNGEPFTERRQDTGNPPLDEELQIHKWSDRVVKNITRKKWMVRGGLIQRTFNMVVTPRVVKEVREHFNCSTLEGAELEDQGGDGTALTHWEKRLFENEAMTGTHTQNSVFSRITFAMMEDTGWYRADYNQAAPLHWGRNLGCVFAQESCKRWINQERIKRHNPAPFCERIKGDPLRTECSPRRDAVVLCNLVRHDTVLPRAYQHFDSLPGVSPTDLAHYGGSVTLADYCPYLQQFTWRHKTVLVRGSRCSYEENTPKTDVNFALENYGSHSKCFDHSDRVWEQKSCRQIREWQHWGSGCYKYKCESGRLHIVVGNYTYMCMHAGQVLMIRIINNGWLHKGGVVCPPCREMCAEEFASRGEYCKGGEEAMPPNMYPNDILSCGADNLTPAIIFSAAIFVATLVNGMFGH